MTLRTGREFLRELTEAQTRDHQWSRRAGLTIERHPRELQKLQGRVRELEAAELEAEGLEPGLFG